MRSTKTRLAASVLAITIPLVPTAAHADPKSTEMPSVNQPGLSSVSALEIADSLSSADKPSARLTAQQKSIVARAIESAAAAAVASLRVMESQRSNDVMDLFFLGERRAQADTALDAAFAEVSYALDVIGPDSHAVEAALTLIHDDLAKLRA